MQRDQDTRNGWPSHERTSSGIMCLQITLIRIWDSRRVPTTRLLKILTFVRSSHNTNAWNARGPTRLLLRIPFLAISCFRNCGVVGISGYWVFGNLRCLCFRSLCGRRGVWISKLPFLGATCDFDLPRFMDHSLIGFSDFAEWSVTA